MNKSLVSRLVLLFVLMLAGCSSTGITESPILLYTWSQGRIQLAPGASIKNADNVAFSVNDQQIALASLATYKWVNFSKIDENQPATFTVVSPNLSDVSTHIVLAKQTTGQEVCPPWAAKIFGQYCQSETLSVP